jgi:hypothetical protein
MTALAGWRFHPPVLGGSDVTYAASHIGGISTA